MDSSIVPGVIGFCREPPLPVFQATAKDLDMFAYYYFHVYNIRYAIADI